MSLSFVGNTWPLVTEMRHLPRKKFFGGLVALTLPCMVAGCSQAMLSSSVPQIKPPQTVGWVSRIINAPEFDLYAALKTSGMRYNDSVTIYIEGDGYSWINRRTPSADPTPLIAVGYELAVKDTSQVIAYIARPCQFVGASSSRNCDVSVWTSHRYSPDVLAATNFAIQQLKAEVRAKRVRLVGYSGGAAVALLVAASRNDVDSVVTVAGNLDTDAWVALHNLKPMNGSLNPADFAAASGRIPQTHFVGANDVVVPKEVAFSYARKASVTSRLKIRIIDGYSHVCCWASDWGRMIQLHDRSVYLN